MKLNPFAVIGNHNVVNRWRRVSLNFFCTYQRLTSIWGVGGIGSVGHDIHNTIVILSILATIRPDIDCGMLYFTS